MTPWLTLAGLFAMAVASPFITLWASERVDRLSRRWWP